MTTTQSTALVTTKDKIKTVGEFLGKLKPSIANALPKHLTADRMARLALTAAQQTPALLDCSPQSLALCILGAAQLGLEPGPLGHVYLVPYKTTATLIVGYRGMIELARRSGQIVSLHAYAVHKGDEFEYAYGLHPDVKHKPAIDGSAGEVTHFYAVANLVGGGTQFVVMSRAEVDAIRQRSRASSAGPWVTDYEEMGKKTAIRRLFKMLPVSVEMARAANIDEQADRGDAQDLAEGVIDTTAEDTQPARTAGDLARMAEGAQS